MTGRKLGGKLDDITVIVGAIVATDAAQRDIAAAERLSQQMQKEAETIKKRAAGEEAKTLRSVHLSQTNGCCFTRKGSTARSCHESGGETTS